MISNSLGSSRRFNALPSAISDDLAEFAQLLFTMIVPHADDFGRMAGDPLTIRLKVFPGSRRTVEEFEQALKALHTVELVTVYEAQGDIWLQINKFEDHQLGLHKRTESRIPEFAGTSRNFPETPASRARVEENLREGNLREEKRREDGACTTNGVVRHNNGNGKADHGAVNARSKRPIFTGQRLVVFEWMFDDLRRMLGSYTDAFDLHEWFFTLDRRAAESAMIIPQRDRGAWLEQQTLAEAKRRGLTIASAEAIRQAPRHRPAQFHYESFDCSHTPHCLNRNDCALKNALASAKEAKA